jgi:hypothetical protein
LLAEFSVATNNTCIGSIAAAYVIKPVNGVTLILLGSAPRHAGITLISVLSFNRPSGVRNCERQHKADERRRKESENSSGHLYFLLTD